MSEWSSHGRSWWHRRAIVDYELSSAVERVGPAAGLHTGLTATNGNAQHGNNASVLAVTISAFCPDIKVPY